jgi:predicted alpha/beta-fold hydrolase
LRKKLAHFPEHDFGAELNQAKTLDDLNLTFIPKFTPYPDAESYFSSYTLTGDRLKALSIPAHLIATLDDPIIPAADLDKINCPEKLSIEVQQYGGHCGFIQSFAAHSWIESKLVQLFEGHLAK